MIKNVTYFFSGIDTLCYHAASSRDQTGYVSVAWNYVMSKNTPKIKTSNENLTFFANKRFVNGEVQTVNHK